MSLYPPPPVQNLGAQPSLPPWHRRRPLVLGMSLLALLLVAAGFLGQRVLSNGTVARQFLQTIVRAHR